MKAFVLVTLLSFLNGAVTTNGVATRSSPSQCARNEGDRAAQDELEMMNECDVASNVLQMATFE
jgi:hypothetical protein